MQSHLETLIYQEGNRQESRIDRWISRVKPVADKLFPKYDASFAAQRRKFLRDMALLGAAALVLSPNDLLHAVDTSESVPTPEQKEKIGVTDLITYIDLDPNYDSRLLLQKLSGFQIDKLTTYPEDHDAREQALSADLVSADRAPMALAQLMLDSFRSRGGSIAFTDRESTGIINHASLVTETSQVVLRDLNWSTSEPVVLPLQSMISDGKYMKNADSLPQLNITVDEQLIINALQSVNDPIINMSFQVGEWSITVNDLPERVPKNYHLAAEANEFHPTYYTIQAFDNVEYPSVMVDEDGKPISEVPKPKAYYLDDNGEKKYLTLYTLDELGNMHFPFQEEYEAPDPFILEAYRPETAHQNFLRLIKICNAYPDKLFVTAAGNYNSLSGDQRNELSGVWPKNLLLTGLGLVPVSFGGVSEERLVTNNISDIYLPVTFGKHAISSSESAGVISALAAIVKTRNNSFSATQIRQYLIERCTDTVETENGATIRVLNYDRSKHLLEDV